MLTPEYLQNVPDNMIKLYAQAEADILADMARRISTYDYWIPAVEHQTKMLEEAGMVREDILARLKKLTGKTKKELRELMQDAGNVALKSDDEVYKRNGLDPPPIGASKDLQQILQAGYDKTAGTFQNLTMTTVRTATRQFEQALDRAYMQITMGGMDYNTSIRRAIKQLSADGVGAIKYPSGRVDSIEVAVRRALVTGVNQTALRLQDARADGVGSDLVEVSAHSGARPEHAKWQGGIYSRSGKSKKYPGLVEVTGYGTALGLGGINCSHSFRPWFEGMSRTYSEGLLEEYEARNFEYNGKKLTEYEALQEQRKIERNIRRWKREQNAMAAAGQDVSESAAKVREWNATHRDFLEQTGLKPDATRLAVGKGGTMSGSRQHLTSKVPGGRLKVKEDYPTIIGGVKCKVTTEDFDFSNGARGVRQTVESVIYTTSDGVKFIFPKKYDKKCQTMTPEKAIELYHRVPKALRDKGQKIVEIQDVYNPMDSYWKKKYKNFTHSYATGGDRLTFWRHDREHDEDYVVYTYCHEMGHKIDTDIAVSSRYSEETTWKAAMRADKKISGLKAVTVYGENSSVEDFAEAVAHYTKDKSNFETTFPNRAFLLERILGY